MSVEVDKLETNVRAMTDTAQSAITLLGTLSGLIRAGAGDRTKMVALADELDQKKTQLAQAIVENTPAATS